jgi:hypothetical protein
MRLNAIVIPALALSLFTLVACNKKQPKPAAEEEPDTLHKVDSVRREPNRFLHKTFQLKKTQQFSFTIPPHTPIPHLQGTFNSFIPRPGDEPLADDTTNVDCLLLDPDQYTEFVHGNFTGTALYSTGPTHDHEVDYSLSPTIDQPATYYVVFRSSGTAPMKTVKADFTITYGY